MSELEVVWGVEGSVIKEHTKTHCVKCNIPYSKTMIGARKLLRKYLLGRVAQAEENLAYWQQKLEAANV